MKAISFLFVYMNCFIVWIAISELYIVTRQQILIFSKAHLHFFKQESVIYHMYSLPYEEFHRVYYTHFRWNRAENMHRVWVLSHTHSNMKMCVMSQPWTGKKQNKPCAIKKGNSSFSVPQKNILYHDYGATLSHPYHHTRTLIFCKPQTSLSSTFFPTSLGHATSCINCTLHST